MWLLEFREMDKSFPRSKSGRKALQVGEEEQQEFNLHENPSYQSES